MSLTCHRVAQSLTLIADARERGSKKPVSLGNKKSEAKRICEERIHKAAIYQQKMNGVGKGQAAELETVVRKGSDGDGKGKAEKKQ